jgi:hypothetical protein
LPDNLTIRCKIGTNPNLSHKELTMYRQLKAVLALVGLIVLLTGQRQITVADGVVGDGNPASCTEAALTAALVGGGVVTFNCGGLPHTIPITSEKMITADTTLLGDGLITLDGGGTSRILRVQTGASLTVQALRLQNGFTTEEGGAIYAEEQTHLTVELSEFSGNVSTQTAENYAGGGAISIERRSTALISGSFFSLNQAGNGGAIAMGGWNASDEGGVITIADTAFTANTATNDGSIPGGGDGGGAIYLKGGVAASISQSQFSDNVAANGGAIHLLNAEAAISHSHFEGNIAYHNFTIGGGGAIYMDGGREYAHGLTIQHSVFRQNSSNLLGGAIFSFPVQSETTHIEYSAFDLNQAHGQGQGGAIYHQSAGGQGSLIIDSSAFAYNDAHATNPQNASQGGALWLINGPTTIRNSSFYANNAANLALPTDDWKRGFGGAVVAHTPVTVINSTFAYNTAGALGGAFAPANPNLVTVRNTIIAHNSGGNVWGIQPNCTQSLLDGGHNLQFPAGECLAGQNADPLLGTFGNYGGPTHTLPLLPGSPALDAGHDCPATDQRGFARLGVCDIGAYEAGAGLVITALSPSWRGLNESGDLLLRVQGVGFTSVTEVRWQGMPQPTSYEDGFRLTAVIPAADLNEVGTFAVTVYDADSGLESEAAIFTIVPTLHRTYLPLLIRE